MTLPLAVLGSLTLPPGFSYDPYVQRKRKTTHPTAGGVVVQHSVDLIVHGDGEIPFTSPGMTLTEYQDLLDVYELAGDPEMEFHGYWNEILTVRFTQMRSKVRGRVVECSGILQVIDIVQAMNIDCGTADPPFPDPELPDVPQALRAEGTGETTIDVDWDEVDDADGYRLQRSPNGSTGWTQIAETGPGVITFGDTGLERDTEYFYRVRAFTDVGESGWTPVQSAMTDPEAAPVLQVGALPNPTQVQMTWTDPYPDELNWDIERSDDGVTGWAIVGTRGPDITNGVDSSLTPDTEYFYRVRAIRPGGPAPYSNVESVTTLPGFPPDAPNILQANAISSSEIDLTWSDNAHDETAYELQRSSVGMTGPWTTVDANLPADTEDYSDSGLNFLTQYWYRVRCRNVWGDSDWSNVATATTDGVPPNAPSFLSAEADGTDRIDLVWIDNSTNEDNFELQRSLDGVSGWATFVFPVENQTTYTNTGLTEDTEYFYRIRAQNVWGDSAWSNIMSATTDEEVLVVSSWGTSVIGSGWTPLGEVLGAADDVVASHAGVTPGFSTSILDISYNLTALPDAATIQMVGVTLRCYKTGHPASGRAFIRWNSGGVYQGVTPGFANFPGGPPPNDVQYLANRASWGLSVAQWTPAFFKAGTTKISVGMTDLIGSATAFPHIDSVLIEVHYTV